MTIVEIHGQPKKAMTFETNAAAKDAMKSRRSGPYEYDKVPMSDRWYVIRRIDRHILCTDRKWRDPFKVVFR